MAYSDEQNEINLPGDGNKKIKSSDLLPRFYRTLPNKKFLDATLDQLISKGGVKSRNGYIGRKTGKSYKVNDTYIPSINSDREFYQFESSTVVKDQFDNVTFFKDYIDYLNQLKYFGSAEKDQNKINAQEFYSWDPKIDWDKFVNYRNYYWLPYGPPVYTVVGQQRAIVSTFTLTLVDDGDNKAVVLTPNGVTRNPTIRLYRGQTYRFEVNSPGEPIIIKSVRTLDQDGFISYDGDQTNVIFEGIEQGVIEFTPTASSESVLYFMSTKDVDIGGVFKISDIVENSFLDLDQDILGKKTYKTADGVELTNGMKVRFAGNVTPEKYSAGFWYVEGVGDKINLVAEADLEITGTFSSESIVLFDDEPFDKLPFSEALTLADKQDYITVSRQSIDKNPWSRHNRWFHIDAITKAYDALGVPADIDLTTRAIRPIIEFKPNIQLLNFGRQAKQNVDLIDTFTTDVFSTIEGSQGFYVDGVLLVKGMRVLFAADTDKRVNGRIFKVDFVNLQGSTQITLKEEVDTDPNEGECVLVNYGTSYKGSMWHYNGTRWVYSQQKTAVNQNPLFDLFDIEGDSFSNELKYEGTTFVGNKLFTYKVGTGVDDAELGFPLTYQNIENVGDIVFNFDLESESVSYRDLEKIVNVSTNTGFLKINSSRIDYTYETGWIKNENPVYQYVIKQYDVTDTLNDFKIDCYRDSSQLDLIVKIFVNGQFVDSTNYEILSGTVYKFVRFNRDLAAGSSLVIKAYSDSGVKISGYYDSPYSLKHNPLNESLDKFTLGEVVDHVQSIVENVSAFKGTYPGVSNLRDLGPVSKYGTRFLQHSIPLNLPLYHLCDKSANVIRAIEYASSEYQKFKRAFIQEASSLALDGTVKERVDQVLNNLIKNKTESMPFRFSDMIPNGAANKITIPVVDGRVELYPLTSTHSNTQASDKAVLVYLNNNQLIYEQDYTFTEEGFVNITASLAVGDVLEFFEYVSTDNSFVPPTPTKLGLYPKYVPQIFVDDTYITPTSVIQGHDGSILKAYGDARDQLLLELELRIFNNIKVNYDPTIFNIFDYVPNGVRASKVSKSVIDDLLSPSFYRWVSFTDSDPTENTFYDFENRFTYNYSLSVDKQGAVLPGYWRGIFKLKFDTDRPHTHPWECLGFAIKPSWWNDVYGPAPYTSDNLILWQDLEAGAIRQPGKTVQYDTRFLRPGLSSNIPVDSEGNLIDPLSANLVDNFSVLTANERFAFGDNGPVETAWRRSSDFPFQFIKSITVARPAESFSVLFDRVRQVKNLNNQFIYKDSGIRIRLNNISTPTVWFDTAKTFCSGLVNYVCDYITSDQKSVVERYRKDLTEITNNLSYRVEGFSDKDKFKIYLDSKSPNSGSLLTLPEENYLLFLNTSSPVETLYYSGVIVEKQPAGYIVRGYNFERPVFEYFKPIVLDKDRVVRVGGISEGYSEWNSNNLYVVGKVVLYQNNFYRAKVTHTSTASFEADKFVRIPELPVVGGKTAYIRTAFEDTVSRLPYGSVLKTIQDVVDFLLGYGAHLESKGFVFDKYDNNLGLVQNWKTSSQEFLFWTTQGFGAGSLLALSPAAQSLKLNYPYAVVDNIRDGFNGYSLRQQDGTLIDVESVSTGREGNEFTLSTVNTNNGIYGASLHLVQKEHVVVFDNISEFNDILFDQKPGFRQERIKVVGYTTYPWIGSFDSPGFVYDQAKIVDWSPYVDYNVGDIVKYKQFYYTAAKFNPGRADFDSNEWFILDSKPESQLLPNWDYKADQFRDFYDLDSTNFDKSQQQLAQHTIGYQVRDYLNQIIPSPVSQYKFYQGYIIEKGTKNSLIKFFDAVSQSNKDSLEFYEDWGVRVGQYGASQAFKEVEIQLDEKQFLINPQPFEVVNVIDNTIKDFVYRQEFDQLYIKPDDADINLWPTTENSEIILRDTGFVQQSDVKISTYVKENLLNQSVSDLTDGDLIWIFKEDFVPNFTNSYWNIYRYTRSSLIVKQLTTKAKTIEIICDNIKDIAVGDYIALYSVPTEYELFYRVKSIELDKITLETTLEDLMGLDVYKDITFSEDSSSIVVFKLVSVRIDSIDAINDRQIDYEFTDSEKFYADSDGTGKWAVYARKPVFTSSELIPERRTDNLRYGAGFSITPDSSLIAVGSVDKEVRMYLRPRAGDPLISIQTILPAETFADSSVPTGWSKSVAISSDGKYLAIGAPDASGFKSFYRGKFNPSQSYNPGRIVSYNQLLWKSKKFINASSTTVPGEDVTEWEITNVIPVEAYEPVPGPGTYLQHQGYISIYEKDGRGNFSLSATFCSPKPDNNEYFGTELKFAGEETGEYTLLVSAPGANQNQGRIYTFRFDESDNDSSFNWKLIRNPKFRGEFSPLIDYTQGDIVYYNNNVYQAIQDRLGDGTSFEVADWEVAGFENIAGYLPLTVHDDITDDSTTLGYNVAAVQSGDLFGSSFAVSDNAEFIVASAPEADQLNLENYQGVYSEQADYQDQAEVSYNNKFYKLKEGEEITYPSGAFDNSKWEQIVTKIKQGTGKVFLYKKTVGGYQLAETISVDKIRDGLISTTNYNYVNEINYYEKFGSSVDISKDGRYIAIGAARADGQYKVQGKVFIFEYVDFELTLIDVISNPLAKPNENFGYRVKFNNDASSIAVTAKFGDQYVYTTFDKYSSLLEESNDLYNSIYATDTQSEENDRLTTFDRQSLNFKTTTKDAGRVYVFDRYADRFIYGESFDVPNSANSDLGEKIAFTRDSIIVNAKYFNIDNRRVGKLIFFERPKNKRTYEVTSRQTPTVNTEKFVSAFLYNTVTNQKVRSVDFIDVLQGKLPGLAEQELAYKTYFDPAVYDVGTDSQQVDPTVAWDTKQVGKLWWDLTNARFYNPYQGDLLYRANVWNRLVDGASIDVYEWVESPYTPSVWDSLADTEEGLTEGISGQSRYGDAVYSVEQRYDVISQTFRPTYYFWVKNKVLVPPVNGRTLSALNVANLIADPRAQGYKYINFLAPSAVSFINCGDLLIDKQINANIRYWGIEKTDLNIHNQYQLITEGVSNFEIPKYIESKWFDSLVGLDQNNNIIPDPDLPKKLKYGILNVPRQGMFINRIEATKQFVERLNRVLINELITDNFNLEKLQQVDPLPTERDGRYDVAVDSYEELRFVGTSNVETARFAVELRNGRFFRVTILNPGSGYKIPPKIEIVDDGGQGALLKTEIDAQGRVTDVVIRRRGKNYTNPILTARPFTVLVRNDSTTTGKWSLYTWDKENRLWNRIQTQRFDVTKFWNYADWYAEGYNQFTKPDYQVNNTYELTFLDASIDQIVRVKTVGSGGWLLLKKYQESESFDYTQSYQVVGRQGGTIQFNANLYDFAAGNIGYGSSLYDVEGYDLFAAIELRIILETIRDEILIGDLRKEYNNLFFTSVRYVLSEQTLVDWVFKTSLVTAIHNLGELDQPPTYKTSSLEAYQGYVEEVKPFRTQIREYISLYESLDNTQSAVTDFDLPSYVENKTAQPVDVKVSSSGELISSSNVILEYPWRSWFDNYGFYIKDAIITDGGSGYISAPVVRFEGGFGQGAAAKAYISSGRVFKIEITNPGSGYVAAPTIVLDGGLREDGVPAKVSAIIENDVIRSNTIGLKFDRITSSYDFIEVNKVEEFSGFGNRVQFALTWPIDLTQDSYTVKINGIAVLKTDYSVFNKTDTSGNYTKKYGVVQFEIAPATGATIEVSYKIDLNFMSAADRIYHSYQTAPGKLGKDLGQLMKGVDYGGVEVTSIPLTLLGGFDSDAWESEQWDDFDETFDDYIVTVNDSTYEFTLPYTPAAGVVLNVYKNGQRLDDPNFGTEDQTNLEAVMSSIVCDGITKTFVLPNLTDNPPLEINNGDEIIFRKTTSDGSRLPSETSYDTQLSGGDLAYNTASGFSPSDISLDGDGFVTPNTSHAPEEIVPGHVFDTLSIKVQDNVSVANSKIILKTINADGTTFRYLIGQKPTTENSVIVKLDNDLLKLEQDYNINFYDSTITFLTVPPEGSIISIWSFDFSGLSIYDNNFFIGDGSTREFITQAPYTETQNVLVIVDGVQYNAEIFETDSSYATEGLLGIRFIVLPAANSVIKYVVYDGPDQEISIASLQEIRYVPPLMDYLLTNPMGESLPYDGKILVKKGNTVLKGPDSYEFTITADNYSYRIESQKYAPFSFDPTTISVFVNGDKKDYGIDFSVDFGLNRVTMNTTAVSVGDTVTIIINKDLDYEVTGTTPGSVYLKIKNTSLLTYGDTIEVLSFYNHNSQNILRYRNTFVTSTIVQETVQYYLFSQFKGGLITLQRSVKDISAVWVMLNRTLLTPNIDYILLDTNTIKLNPTIQIDQTDTVDVMQFDDRKSSTIPISFVKFKDILNRNSYYRLNYKFTQLASDLRPFDRVIEVIDGSVLDEPSRAKNRPGVVEIAGERVEYFVKNGNFLSQIRRGTLGTGVKDIHLAGQVINNIGISETVPYGDSTEVYEFVSDGSTLEFSLPFVPVKTSVTDWYRDTIPSTHGQCNQIDVFAAGRHLRKAPLVLYDKNLGPDFENDTSLVEAEFSVDGANYGTVSQPEGKIRLTSAIPAGTKVVVTRKVGQMWQNSGQQLTESITKPALFLRRGG